MRNLVLLLRLWLGQCIELGAGDVKQLYPSYDTQRGFIINLWENQPDTQIGQVRHGNNNRGLAKRLFQHSEPHLPMNMINSPISFPINFDNAEFIEKVELLMNVSTMKSSELSLCAANCTVIESARVCD